MNAHTVTLVQHTWQKAATNAPAVAQLFYANLFAADPELKKLFKGDITEQGKRLTQMIGAAVNKLDNLETLVPILENLAVRHVRYGVKNSHYETVGGALLKTLAQSLGDSFTPDVQTAWTEVYAIMSSTMISATEAAIPC
jgi:hemoglobin-like flavoprotein